ncbi:MAG: hypothetical protein ACTSXL_01590 [Alphaproteobacteria bacterium]|nr:MAG: hypothetical protein B6I23_01715 [Rickettsiaceae bacterium 4572_127]
MTKGQKKLFNQIERGVKAGAETVIEIAERTKTPIVVSCPNGEIKKLTPAEAKKVLEQSKKKSS